jgi:DnaA family protein
MVTPRQYTLAIDHPHRQTLDTFVAGDNTELLQALRQPGGGFSGYWVFGDLGSGRSHLLRGCALAAQQDDVTVNYVACEDFAHHRQGLEAALHHAGQYGQLVAIDDVGAVVGDVELEALLLGVYQRLHAEQGRLLITHSRAAQGLAFATPDLASRMRSLQHFQIVPLSDDDKMRLLRGRAAHRGYELSQQVLDYWLARGPRDLGALLIDLETLDGASLARHKKVTIPLLKQVLGY